MVFSLKSIWIVSAVKLSRCWLCELRPSAFSSLSVLSDIEVHPFELALSFRELVLSHQGHCTRLCDDCWWSSWLSSQFFPIHSAWTQSLSHYFFSRPREWCPPLHSSPCRGLFFLVVYIAFRFLGAQTFLVSVTEVSLLPSPALSTAKPCLSNPPMLGSASSTFPHSHSLSDLRLPRLLGGHFPLSSLPSHIRLCLRPAHLISSVVWQICLPPRWRTFVVRMVGLLD